MLEDLERGKPLELPWLSGAVVRLGARRGVPTPTHALIETLLRPFVKAARRRWCKASAGPIHRPR